MPRFFAQDHGNAILKGLKITKLGNHSSLREDDILGFHYFLDVSGIEREFVHRTSHQCWYYSACDTLYAHYSQAVAT